jgi:hypothetical protein
VASNVLSGNANADVDLFISAIDARLPTSEDFDFKSDNMGADNILISSTDSFWANKGY